MKIYMNLWAASPQYFVCMRTQARYAYGVVVTQWAGKMDVRNGSFFKHDLRDSEHFPVVGKIDLDKIVADAVLQAIGKTGEE